MASGAAYPRVLFLLALTTWLLYAASSTGTLSADPSTRFEVAENLARHGEVALPEAGIHTTEHHGKHYSVFFPGQSILFLPVAAAGVAASEWLGVEEDLASYAARFFSAVFLMPCFGALAVVGHVRVLRQLKVGEKTALLSGAILALGTPLWVYGSRASEETILAALGIWSIWLLLDAHQLAQSAPRNQGASSARQLANRLGLAGILIAAGIVDRSTFVTFALGAMVIALPILARALRPLLRAKARLTLWMLAIIAVVAVVPAYNWLRFDNPLDTGYGRFWEPFGGVFDTPLLVGLHGHLTSPGKSLFLYVPWLILLPLAWPGAQTRRRLGLLTSALLAIIISHLLIYSLHTCWSGEFCWGVRFHTSLLPLLLVPIAVWLDGLRLGGVGRGLLAALAAVSVAVQLAATSLNWGLEHRQHPEYFTGHNELIPAEAAWTWKGSQLPLRFANIIDKLSGRELLDVEADDPRRIVTVWDVFPARAGAALDNRPISRALWILWAILVTLTAISGWCTIRTWRALAARDGPSGTA